MDIKSILQEYDGMFGHRPLTQIEEYLAGKIGEAKRVGDESAEITLLNEMIGLCRDTSQGEKALEYCGQLKELLHKQGLEGTKDYATSMQNIANAYRAFGLWEKAKEAFEDIERTYKESLDKGDYLWASMYNNWGLLYQEMQDYDSAVATLKKALELIEKLPGCEIKVAVTKTNLANSLFALGTDEAVREGYMWLEQALKVFVEDGERDFHYGASVVAMGDYYVLQREWAEAAEWYRKGMVEILIHTGRTEFYDRVLEKYEYVEGKQKKNWENNLTRSRRFYEEYGRAMIHREFPEYEDRIAVGMVGEGSDCYGFDDEISADHDYALGFCMWLTDSDMEAIGEDLQAAYDRLVGGTQSARLLGRRGVCRIDDFYGGGQEEYELAGMVNGEVFEDKLGEFSARRQKLLEYYPEEVWRGKLANLLHEFAQYGQANYARMMARKDYLTAGLCISKAIESAMDIGYVLCRTYAPYYKWKRKGLEKLGRLQDIVWICEELSKTPCQIKAWKNVEYSSSRLNTDDRCVVLIETLAGRILEELKSSGLVKGTDTFLENYVAQVLEGGKPVIDKIIELEWKQFDKVINEGGRASCQNNYGTFSIMRRSQYMAWNEDLLNSYYNDLVAAQQKGWNLITEKYARMMKSTAPDRYATLQHELPARSPEREQITEEIVRIQVAWMEEFAQQYPKMAENARSIHTYQDTEYDTSYETYLRGELGTYGEETFVLYGRFIADLMRQNRNLAYEIMRNTAGLYGYESLEKAEASIISL